MAPCILVFVRLKYEGYICLPGAFHLTRPVNDCQKLNRTILNQ